MEQDQNKQTEVTEQKVEIKIPDGKVLAVLAYLGIFIIIPFLVAKDDDFVGFHLRQGVVLLIIVWLFFLSSMIMPTVYLMMSTTTVFVNSLVIFFILLMTVNGIFNVLNGQKRELPFIGQLAKRFDV